MLTDVLIDVLLAAAIVVYGAGGFVACWWRMRGRGGPWRDSC